MLSALLNTNTPIVFVVWHYLAGIAYIEGSQSFIARLTQSREVDI